MSVLGHRLRAYVRPSGGTWTPTDLPSLAVWYDADTAGDFTLSGSDIVQWNDKSGNARHLSTLTGTLTRQTNIQNGRAIVRGAGNAAIAYTAGSAWLTGATFLIGIATKATTGGPNYERLVSGGDHSTADNSGTGANLLISKQINPEMAVYGSPVSAISMDTWFTVIGYSAATLTGITINGSTPATGSYTHSLNVRTLRLLGDVDSSGNSTTEWVGDVGECVVATAYTSTDREKLEGYIAHRWNLQSLLPGGHPYKTSPP